jgi:hypothetical protein
MKIGDFFVMADSKLRVLDIARVDSFKEESTTGTTDIVINIIWPQDQGELRQFPISHSYCKRSYQILRGPSGSRIQRIRHQLIQAIYTGEMNFD